MKLYDGAMAPNPCVRIFVAKRLPWLDEELASRDFLAGDRFTIADITALVGIEFGRVVKLGIADDQKNLKRWHEAVSARPSARA